MKLKLGGKVYFAAFFTLWAWAIETAIDAFALDLSNPVMAWLWIGGFGFLIFNVVYMFLTSVCYLILHPTPLPEVHVPYIPKTAIIYPVKNETVGILERISFTIENNNLPGVHAWLLSDSDPEYLTGEKELVAKLQERFGANKIFYRHREQPFERKQGNVLSWLSGHLYYKYFFVCDADSMAPKGTLLKLIKKAEHPDHKDIALFQTFIKITHAKTRFAKLASIGSRLSQELYFKTYQTLFSRQISFGHLCLIRTKDFIRIKIPKGILSHDIWDTTYLDAMGKRLAFCFDVKTWDEAPANYLEDKARSKRWAKGTLQSWPLLFKLGVSLPMRLYVFYGIYVYLSHVVLFSWILLNLFLGHPALAHLLVFKSNNTLIISPFMRQELLVGLFFTLGVVYLHRFVLLKRYKLKDIVIDLVFSTLISLNNIYYLTLDILSLPFEGLVWKPMKKDPFSTISFKQTVSSLWPTTALGVLGLMIGSQELGPASFVSLPLFISFAFSIPIVYWTAKPLPSKSFI